MCIRDSLQAEWTPMLADCASASIPLGHVVHGRPRGLLQLPGGLSDAVIAWKLNVPCDQRNGIAHIL